MGNNQIKGSGSLRKSLSLPDTQNILSHENFSRDKERKSNRFFKFGSSRDLNKDRFENGIKHVDSESVQCAVPLVEALFLPEFPVKTDVIHHEYKITELLAKGAYGNVVKIHKEDAKQTYAMKILDKYQIIVEGAIQQVKDEVSIQSTLGDHPFIVNTYEYWQSKNLLYIVLDFVSNGDMFSLWQYHTTLPEKLVIYFIAELAVVLDYLHKAGVIYRDLKLENVLFDPDGHILVTDFGLAKWLQIGDKTNTICGTLQYMAPEVLAIYPYGHTVDWWSLGILMYTLLIGHYPVDGAKNHVEMGQKVLHCEYTLPDTISTKAKEAVSKLLYKSPHRRVADLYSIQNLPLFKHTNFTHLIEKKLCPKDVVPMDFFSLAFTHSESDVISPVLDNGSLVTLPSTMSQSENL